MAFSKQPKTETEFLAKGDSPPVVDLEAVRSTGFGAKGLEGVLSAVPEPAAKIRPWEGLDPGAKPSKSFTLRLNDHDLACLRWLANRSEDISMQKVAQRLLIPEVRRRVGLCG